MLTPSKLGYPVPSVTILERLPKSPVPVPVTEALRNAEELSLSFVNGPLRSGFGNRYRYRLPNPDLSGPLTKLSDNSSALRNASVTGTGTGDFGNRSKIVTLGTGYPNLEGVNT